MPFAAGLCTELILVLLMLRHGRGCYGAATAYNTSNNPVDGSKSSSIDNSIDGSGNTEAVVCDPRLWMKAKVRMTRPLHLLVVMWRR